MSAFTHKYIATRRVTYKDLTGYKWRYVEAPRSLAHNMGGVPVSIHEHGVVETDRFVLESHLERAGLQRWAADAVTEYHNLIEAFPRTLKEEDDD